MGQVSYGTITVSDITDITDVYLEYGLAVDSATVDNNYAFNQTGERGWLTTYPNWQSGYQIWVREVTQKEGLPPEPGTPYLDKAVNQINNNFINLDNRLKNFFYPGDPTYSGAFAVSKGTADGLVVTNANTYGFNTRMSVSSVSMGYNKIPLLEMGILGSNFNGIKLYSPIMDHSTISGNRLDATLTSEGLKLLKGGIEAGTYSSTTTDFIYLSTEDYSNTPIVNIGGNSTGWRQIIGSKFGVKNDGTVYASNADISGAITANSGKIGGWSIGTDTNKSLYYSNSTPGASTNNLVLSPSSAKNTNAIGGSAANLTWFISAGRAFGVTTAGKLYAAGVNISGEIVADGGKIGGLILEEDSVHSNGKTLNNNVAGTYIDSLGQFNTGDGANYIKSWKDPSDNKWKISLRASEMLFSSGANVEDELITAKSNAETAKTSIDKEINGYLSVVVESNVYAESAIEIDAEKYDSSFGEGTNTFTYTNNHWYLNGSLVTEENLSNYGITIKQTPVEGDSFNIIATNVESLSSSLTNLREEVNSNSDSINNLIDHSESNTSSISVLSEKSSATTETVDDLTSQVQELSDTLYGEKAEREARMTFGTDSNGDPILTLGGGAHSDFQMNLTNLKLEFKEKNYTVAFISGHVLTIENANISTQLQMNNFAWIPRKNGHLTLKYMG